ncbi:hypothetical protein [Acetobacter sp.]|uniref:hypothetical protein n=1 Tax=Acetobacter sp. TaxID=440 RepID=UPI0039ED3A86
MIEADTMTALRIWPQEDGQPVTCQEKLRMLEENWQEVQQVLADAFEDAVLMGVSERVMRERLAELVTSLSSPKVAGA